MKLSGNTILITGGSAGIGLSFAERFLKMDNKVIICGRRENVLESAKEKYPELITHICDLAVEADRKELFEWVTSNYPDVNVLINNAGIQNRYNVLKADTNNEWDYFNQEMEINFNAPVHLSMLFAQFFANKKDSVIINVTSGLAFTPLAIAPVYSATKAALHSFTMSLRHQLSDASIEVIEIVPPAVNTDLGGVGLHVHGEPLDEFTDGIFKGLEEGKSEIGYGTSVDRLTMPRNEVDQHVAGMYNTLKKYIE